MPDRPGLDISPRKRFKIAIFDYDGTLIDSARIYPFIHKEVLRELGVPEDELSYLTLKFWHDNIVAADEYIDAPAYFVSRHGLSDKVDGLGFRTVRNKVEAEYFGGERAISDLGTLSDYVNKSVVDDLRELHAGGAECYIVSNNYGLMIEKALNSLGLAHMFSDCYTHCLYDELKHHIYDKCQPKMESYEQLIQRARELGGGASDCIVYDDLMKYIEQAQSLGMECVWVDNEHAVPRNR